MRYEITFVRRLERPWPSDARRPRDNWYIGTLSSDKFSCDLWDRRRRRDCDTGRILEYVTSERYCCYSLSMMTKTFCCCCWRQQVDRRKAEGRPWWWTLWETLDPFRPNPYTVSLVSSTLPFVSQLFQSLSLADGRNKTRNTLRR